MNQFPIVRAADPSIIPSIGDQGSRVTQPFFHTPTDLNTVLNTYWDRFSTLLFSILGGLALLLLIYAGIQYITSGGNAEKLKRARQNIINVLLGIILLVSSYAIIKLILTLTGGLAQKVG